MKFFRGWLRLVFEMGRSSPLSAILTGAFALLVGLQTFLELWALARFIDTLPGSFQGTGNQAMFWLLVLFLVVFVGGLGNRFLPYFRDILYQALEKSLMERLLIRAGERPLIAFESPEFHDRLSRVQKSIRENLGEVISSTQQTIQSFVSLLSVIGLVGAANWQSMLVLLLAGGPAWILQVRAAEQWGQMYRAQTERVRRVDYFTDLILKRQHVPEVRLFGLSLVFIQRWWTLSKSLMDERLAMANRRSSYQVLTTWMGGVAFVVAVGLAGLSLIGGRLTIGQFVAILRAGQGIQDMIFTLLMQFGTLQRQGHFLSDMWDFLDEASDRPVVPVLLASSQNRCESAPGIVFEDVSFTYPGASRMTLRNIAASVKPGELVAIVGENGSGKTTLAKLLLGLYQPSHGAVLVGGANSCLESDLLLRPKMAPVFQDYLRYSLTASENIGIGDVADLDNQHRIHRAAEQSGADSAIDNLPSGYATLLGKEFQNGHELSGGEWQKLAIARAYMREADVLILDEPTSALDPMAELDVITRFRDLSRGRTALFISHRMGAARLADRILVLKEGELIEVGSHEELMNRSGEYATLFHAQAHLYNSEV